MFLSARPLPARGTGQPLGVSANVLTFSMSECFRHPFQRCLLSPTCLMRDIAEYSGDAAIPNRRGAEFPHAAPSLPPRFSSWTYSLALPWRPVAEAVGVPGRRGIFIGQCCLPLCPGDLANHLDGSAAVTKYRPSRELDGLPGLQQVREPGPPIPAETRRLPNYLHLAPPSSPVARRRWLHTPIDSFDPQTGLHCL
jgi:hypothetical protein